MPQPAAVGEAMLGPKVFDADIADIEPLRDLPLYQEVLDWLSRRLQPAGLPRTLCKRLALIVCGLLNSETCTKGALTTAIKALEVTKAKDESIAKRLGRSFRDARLDPTILPAVFRPLLPELLRSHLLAHAANESAGPSHHRRFIGVVVIFDESSKRDEVHLAVVGVPVGGVVIPLAVRTWPQNTALSDGQYWVLVNGLLQEVQEVLPAQLREHVLLVADRLYGVPRMVDFLIALGWNWLLRVQGQTRVLLRDGTCRAIRTLVPKPGTQWAEKFSGELVAEAEAEAAQSQAQTLGVFKAAGWRRSRVVAVWAENQADPWLLVTSLAGTLERVAEYATRWAIERLFLSWKSHGWNLEASDLDDPQRLGRLLCAMAIATIWQMAMALPRALEHLTDLAGRLARGTCQLRLPGFWQPPRPYAAKFSLLTWGAKVAKETTLKMQTPALCWHLPSWNGRTWSEMCRHTCLVASGQFPMPP